MTMFLTPYFGFLIGTKIFIIIRTFKVTEYSDKTGLGKKINLLDQ